MSLESRFWAKVDKRGPRQPHMRTRCWVWTAATNKGYGVMGPEGKPNGPCLKAHRAAMLIAGVDITGKNVLHRCDNPSCVRLSHLFTGSLNDNNQDMLRKKRGRWITRAGEFNGNAKLSDRDVAKIRNLYAKGNVTQTALAKQFGCSQGSISDIIHNNIRNQGTRLKEVTQ